MRAFFSQKPRRNRQLRRAQKDASTHFAAIQKEKKQKPRDCGVCTAQ
jgi:hypothetical protein